MRKTIVLLLISLFFLISCGRQDTVEVDTREHYLKAKKYYDKYNLGGIANLHQTDKELERKLELYMKTLSELDLAVFETTGESREEVMDMIEECNDNVDSIRERLDRRAREGQAYQSSSGEQRSHKSSWSLEEMRAAGMEGIGSTQNEAIADSREEIRRRRSAIGSD